jgi:hypothetical protein
LTTYTVVNSHHVRSPARDAALWPRRPPLAARGAENFYGAHITQSQRIYEPYTKEQLELLLEFVRGGRELNENQAVLLEAENRARGAPLRPPKPKPKPEPEPEPKP